jgi:hypothetical protein
MYNLTYGQKKLAEWLVSNVKNENLNEDFFIHWKYTGLRAEVGWISSYKGLQKDLRTITQHSIKVLAENKLLIYKVKSPHDPTSFSKYEVWDCALIPDIYNALDNNFICTDTSFSDYLTPLTDPSSFDNELADRCFPILATGGSDPTLWDSAVRTAGVILEERLRDVGNISDPNQTGQSLVSKVFGNNGTLASKFSVPSEQSGYRDLYAGIVGAFRNPSAHRLVDPSPEEGGAFIVFVNLLLKKLEDLR